MDGFIACKCKLNTLFLQNYRYADQKMTDLRFDQPQQMETLKADVPAKHQLVGKRSIGAADGKQVFLVRVWF
jgi:hypothetical protein